MASFSKGVSELFSRAFGKDITLEHTIFILVAISGIFMSAVGIVGNSSLNLGAIAIVIPSVNIVVDIVCIVYSVFTKKWKIPAIIVILIASFFLFPFLWFTTGGATGSTMPFIVMSGLIYVIIMPKKVRAFLLVTVLSMYVVFILLEMVYPDMVIPYPDREAQYIDLALGLSLSYIVSVTLTYVVLTNYKKAKTEADELVKQLEALSVTDPLTGIYNRRFLSSKLDEEMRNSFDSELPLSICLMDIDFFKKINDTYGHPYGDSVLLELSQTIAGSLNENAIFGRYGGEEFLIIFKDCDMACALEKINAFLQKLKQVKWEHGWPVTISCGVSEYTKGIPYSEFLKSADDKLYKAKEAGRNRVVSLN